MGDQQHLKVSLWTLWVTAVFPPEYLYVTEVSQLIGVADFLKQVLTGTMTLSLKVSREERSPFKYWTWLWEDSVKSGTVHGLRPKFIDLLNLIKQGITLIFNKALIHFNLVDCWILAKEFESFALHIQKIEVYKHLQTFAQFLDNRKNKMTTSFLVSVL